MQPYEKYKDSGVDWIGEIPEGWKILPGLSFIYENKAKNKGMIRNTVLSLSYGKIRVKAESELTGLVPESFETYQLVDVGDVIFRPTDLQNDMVSLRSSISEYKGIITSAYLNLRFKKNTYPRFFHYFFRSIDNNKIIYGLGSGLRQNISYLDFRRFKFPFPPLPEQQSIAAFLEDKTVKIDQTIGIKQKEIELLKERRQILIQKAVTRGLDDAVPLKDSGVDWIGEIPEHWEVRKLKYFIQNLEGGVSVNASESESAEADDFGVLKTSCVYNYCFEAKENKKVFENEKRRVSCQVRKGAIIISRMNTPELVGASGLVLEEYPNLFLPDRLWQTIYQNNIYFDRVWLSKILINKGFRNYMTTFANGSSPSMKNISKGDFLKIAVPFAPKSEQTQIVSYLEEIEEKIAKAILLKQHEIEKLKEYKTVLIDNVVTGKLRVSWKEKTNNQHTD